MLFSYISIFYFIVVSILFCFISCTYCPSNYYYNKGIQFTEEIDFLEDCFPKSPSDLIYEKNIYLRNISCLDFSFPSACSGEYENPFDDFWKAIKKIYLEDKGQKFQTQKIAIIFIGYLKTKKYN